MPQLLPPSGSLSNCLADAPAGVRSRAAAGVAGTRSTLAGASVARPGMPSRASMARRAIVGAAWAVGWTLVWASALLMFETKSQAGPLPPAPTFTRPA
jgi:hypothetical protein